jgi:hypothetical protein
MPLDTPTQTIHVRSKEKAKTSVSYLLKVLARFGIEKAYIDLEEMFIFQSIGFAHELIEKYYREEGLPSRADLHDQASEVSDIVIG